MDYKLKEESLRPSSLSIGALIANPFSQSEPSVRPDGRHIPPVYLSKVEIVPHSHFGSYMKTISPEYDSYQQAKEYGLHQHINATKSVYANPGSIFSGTDAIEAQLADRLAPSVTISTAQSFDQESLPGADDASPTSESVEFDIHLDRARRIPLVFESEHFDLKNPRTFDEIIALSLSGAQADGKIPRSDFWNNFQLQDALSNYVDLLESTLVSEITHSGPMFLDALQVTQSLAMQAARCTEHVGALRELLKQLIADAARAEIQNARGIRKDNKIRSFREILQNLQHMTTDLDHLTQVLVSPGQHGSAKDLMHDIDLQCLRSDLNGTLLKSKIQTLLSDTRARICQDESDLFKGILTAHLHQLIAQCDLNEMYEIAYTRHIVHARARDSRVLTTFLEKTNMDLKVSLSKFVRTLSDYQQLTIAIALYQDACIKEAKMITKRELPTSYDDDDSRSSLSLKSGAEIRDKSALLAKALCDLDTMSFLKMLRTIFTKTWALLIGVTYQGKLLMDVITSSELKEMSKSQDILCSNTSSQRIVEICQTRIMKLLQVRGMINTTILTSEFKEFAELCAVFSAECEAISGQTMDLVLSAMLLQLKQFHNLQFSQLAQDLTTCVDLDTWQPIACSQLVQDACDALFSASTTSTSRSVIDVCKNLLNELDGDNRHILMRNKSYLINRSLAALLLVLSKLHYMARGFPWIRAEVLGNISSLTRFYNTKVHQLILGAGATKTAGLERITAKHLASTAQTLSILAGVIEEIQKTNYGAFSLELRSEYETVLIELVDHRTSIHDKLVSIMEERTRSACIALDTLLRESSEARSEPSSPIVALVKDTLVLHKVLVRFMDHESLSAIMDRVVNFEELQLASLYEQAKEASVEQINTDRQFFLERLKSTSSVVGTMLSKPID